MIVQYRSLPRFQSIVAFGPGDLVVAQGNRESITLEASAELLPLIVTDVTDGVLSVGFKDAAVASLADWRSSIQLKIVVKELNGIAASGVGRVRLADLDADNVKCNMRGRRKLEINQLTADGLSVCLKQGASAVVSGDVETQTVQLADQSTYQAEGLMSDMAGVRLIDHACAHIRVNDELTAYIGGQSSLRYVGYPEVFKQGSGEIVRCREQHQLVQRGSDHG